VEEGAANGQVASVPEAPNAPTAAPTKLTTKSRQNVFVGRVSSNKMDKTVVVRVEKVKRHRLYHRNIHYHVKYYAHDEENACSMGDRVRIVETRPLSKLKRWRVAEILERGGVDRAEV
jgi:small subunit ribosomal protein S17